LNNEVVLIMPKLKYDGDKFIEYITGDSRKKLKNINDNSTDSIVTDPPYGISFMGKDWDKALPSIDIWKECLRVLKPGGFAFVMSIPRSDCLSRMIILLEDAGFNVAFSPIYWTFASGFPKAQNMSKAIDKRFGAEREVTGISKNSRFNDNKMYGGGQGLRGHETYIGDPITESSTPQAKHYDGYYTYNPKPAVEVIIVAMKPLSEKSYIDQALRAYDDDSVQSGCVNFDECRIPYENEIDNKRRGNTEESETQTYGWWKDGIYKSGERNQQGRFPANLLCSDDVLNDGETHSSKQNMSGRKDSTGHPTGMFGIGDTQGPIYNDGDSFSRYFSLDSWWEHKLKSLPESIQKTFPFLITPKSPQKEKCFYCHICEQAYPMVERGNHKDHAMHCDDCDVDYSPEYVKDPQNPRVGKLANRGISNSNQNKRPHHFSDEHKDHKSHSNFFTHPTQKPLKLFSYLITLGSRVGDTILDPFGGTGTAPVACKMLNRNCISTDLEPLCEKIVEKRLNISKSKTGKLYVRETRKLC